ncbi:helix-turn-helix domain-containing protein [Salinarimonas rosea]|uniref:helix-turn-helix domain-containing protein n=1 Tax=Salinarimonas rosea TaxID=552063 RepID=UPI00040F9DC5|nr:helix-turn-helix domain-containing protein [Salinarimonas rosea]
MKEPSRVELVRRAPHPALASVVASLAGYREIAPGPRVQHESATLVVPVIVSFGRPFRIAFGRAPTEDDVQPSFVAGLHAGPVEIRSDGGAECLQIDFTPLGAHRFLGGLAGEIASRMVDIEDALGPAGRNLRRRLGEAATWDERLDLAEAFLLARTLPAARPEIAHLCAAVARTGGAVSIAGIAADIGISRKHLAALSARHLGVGPKTLARMVRFRRACVVATSATSGAAMSAGPASWADVAASCGFADQAHLVREFRSLAGATPTQWLGRIGRGAEALRAGEAAG